MGEGEAIVEVINDGEAQIDNSPKRDHKWIEEEGNELDSFPNKKLAKEASNDEVCSEVSNPNVSPKEVVSSFQAITSQPMEVASNAAVGCGEITSTCSRDSSTDSTKSSTDEEHSGIDTSGAVSTSQVVLEIPKHASSTGIRKITFKFSKTKEEYDNRMESRSNFTAFDDRSRNMRVSTYGSGLSDTGNLHLNTRNMGMKMSEKVLAESYPTNVKKLLSAGILEGARVKYISPTREKELSGIVSREGYLCGCSTCNFSKAVSAYEFELHAGGKTRHPNSYIFMENGKPIYSIIQKLRTAPPSTLDDVIRDVAGSSVNEESFRDWKASIQESNGMVEVDTNDIRFPSLPCSVVSCPSQVLEDGSGTTCSFVKKCSPKQQTYMDMHMPEDRRPVMKKSISHIANSYVHRRKTAEGYTRRRDNDLHRLLFKPNGLPDGAELAYYIKGQRMLGGYKQGNGIVCSCCDREISPSQFEAHAGWAARRQPYRHIYISNGLTLHDIAMSLAKGDSLTTGGSDDMCAACGDGGDLISCEGCPRAFHADCLDIQCIPEGDWYCSHCRDKFGPNTKAVAGDYSGSARPIIIRLTRVVKAPEFETGGCVVCRANDFSVAIFDDRTVIICDQCEKEFHVGCLRDSGLCDLKELPMDKWFCGDYCNRIHMALQNLVFKGAELIPTSSSTIVNRKHTEKGYTYGTSDDIQWRILSGKSRCPEHLPFLSRAAAIFRECFDPIVASSGRDLIPVMVYGRNISGQEFGGMYCVVLIVKSVVVSAGLLRVFNREVAELPLVATSREYQGKGYFQALFSCIEGLLYSLNVENLVLPAAEDAESIWTKKLGFRKMSEERLSKLTRDLQLTVFKGTSMLEKEVQHN